MNYVPSNHRLQTRGKIVYMQVCSCLTFQQDSQNSLTLTVRQSVIMKTVKESEGRQL